MSTILQSCFESQFIETATVKLKFAPTNSVEFASWSTADAMEHKGKCQQQQLAMHVGGNSAAKTDLCGLSFQQVLANYEKETNEKETVYVHPLSKRSSSSRFSEKSFEMCTENLGSETGTDDIMDSSILSLSSSSFNINSPREKSSSSSSSSPREYSRNKVINSRNFPPPLTTISGANSLEVRPHREGGRLVIKAIESPAKHTYLRAERSNGRLRLCLLKDNATDFDLQESNEIDSEEEVEEENENESYINDEDLEELEENQDLDRDQNDENDDEDNESDAQMIFNKGIDANNFDNEVETGKEKFPWPSRCNEAGHGNTVLYNYKPLWVTS